MLDRLQVLNEDEYSMLIDSVSLITVLIAGADDHIDPRETDWAEKITRIRSYNYRNELKGFYLKVGEDYSERLHDWINRLPNDREEREKIITEELEKLNPILQKLEEGIADLLYKSLTSFARHVARASGGIAGFGSITPEEAKYIDLPMIDPVD